MTDRMRVTLAFALLSIGISAAAQAAPGADAVVGDLNDLQGRWHQCVRETYAGQSSKQSIAASQLNALDACKEYEDAYVTAVMASQVAEDEASRKADRPLTARAKAWVSSALSYVFDPATNWISRPFPLAH